LRRPAASRSPLRSPIFVPPRESREAAHVFLYCGEWIESHALHIYLLHAPDFLGYTSALDLAKDRRSLVERGLALKKAGNAIMELVGGRAIHPVNVRVGGFYRAPAKPEMAVLAEKLRIALDQALDTVSWAAGFEFPDFHHDHEMLALVTPGRYAIERGTVASTGGLTFAPAEFETTLSRSTCRTRRRCTPGWSAGAGT